jgi:hypothetical protein
VRVMRAIFKLVVAIAAGGIVLATSPAPPAAAAARPNRISIDYVIPKNPSHQPIYQRLKEARFLEKLQAILSPFRLPRMLRIKLQGCDGDANAWYEDDVITVCYEYVDEIYKGVPAETAALGVTPIDALVGPVSTPACMNSATRCLKFSNCRCSGARRMPPTRSPPI